MYSMRSNVLLRNAPKSIEQIPSQYSIKPHRSKDAEALYNAEVLRRYDARADRADQHHPERHGSPYGDSPGPFVPASGDNQNYQ